MAISPIPKSLLPSLFNKLLELGKPYYLRELFIEDLDNRRSERLAAKRNQISFKIPNFATIYYENSFVVSAICLWQELPLEILQSSSIDVFRNRIHDYLLNLDIR